MALKPGLFDGVTQHDKRMNALAKHRARLRHHCGFDDGGMFEQDVLDLGGEDLVAPAVDHVLDAIDDSQVAAFIYNSEIARLPIPGAELTLGGFGMVLSRER
jgi:hypothetical protein